MPLFLITGHSGTGKSTLAAELSRRGFRVIDADIDQTLTEWRCLKTKKAIPMPERPVDVRKYGIFWNEEIMEEWLRSPKPRFICGLSGNVETYLPRFKKIFVLEASEATTRERLLSRTGNSFGQDAREWKGIVAARKKWNPWYAHMHTVLNAETPVGDLAEQIIETLPALARLDAYSRLAKAVPREFAFLIAHVATTVAEPALCLT